MRSILKKEKTLSQNAHNNLTAYFMIFPALLVLAIFVYAPLFLAISKSMTNWSFYGTSEFIWFKNFALILKNQLFRVSIVNALKFVGIIVPIQLVLSFLFAHVLKSLASRMGTFVKSSIYIPTVIAGVIASVIFIFIFDYSAGLANVILGFFGVERQAFLADPKLALFSVCLPIIWLGFGYNSLVMFAGLINIPKEYYESADIDGAGFFTKMIKITIPSLKNTVLLLCINLVTTTIQLFDVPYVMTGGGPLNKTITPIIYLFNSSKSNDQSMGYTLAGALLVMIVITLVNTIVFRVIQSDKSADD